MKKIICKNCGFTALANEFLPSTDPHYTWQCPNCKSVDLDTSQSREFKFSEDYYKEIT